MSRLAVALVILVAASPVSAAEPNVPETNIVFRNATIYDGTGGSRVVRATSTSRATRSRPSGRSGRSNGATEIDAHGAGRLPRVHRPAHALRLRR